MGDGPGLGRAGSSLSEVSVEVEAMASPAVEVLCPSSWSCPCSVTIQLNTLLHVPVHNL